MEVPNLVEVLSLLAVSGGLGPVFSFLSENSEWFQKLKPKVRFWFILVSCLGIPILARLVLQLVPANVWEVLEPYWQSLALGFLAFLTAQGYHIFKRLRG